LENFNDDRRLHYIATLISNILRVNSAVDHQTMGMRIHRLIEKANPVPPLEAVVTEVPVEKPGHQLQP
jgi:hypothetical protein